MASLSHARPLRALVLGGLVLILLAAGCKSSQPSPTPKMEVSPSDCSFDGDGTLFDYASGRCTTPSVGDFDKMWVYAHLYGLSETDDNPTDFAITFSELLSPAEYRELIGELAKDDHAKALTFVFPNAPGGSATIGTTLDAAVGESIAAAQGELVNRWTGQASDWGDEWSASMVEHLRSAFDSEDFRVEAVNVITKPSVMLRIIRNHDEQIRKVWPADEGKAPPPPPDARMQELLEQASSEDLEEPQ